MTKIKYSALVSDMSGKLNGSVMSRNKAGSYIRNKVTPANPQTSYQLDVRNRVASLSKAWAALTDAQRASWNSGVSAFAKTNIFGDMKNPSGFNLFVKINSNLLAVGTAQLNSCPAVTAQGSVVISAVTADNSSQSISVTFSVTNLDADRIKVEATPAMGAGVKFVKNAFRVITYDATVTSPLVFTSSYLARLGAIGAAGQKIHVRLTPMSSTSGQQGLPAEFEGTIVA